MVAVIKFSASLRNVLNYNENKLKQKQASLIHSSGFAKDTDRLGFSEKFNRIEKQRQLNAASVKNVAHISLNFDPSEKLSDEKLKQIADTYMKGIGFGDQPYLVYQHFDAAHPHIHIVSTTIQRDGTRIKTHKIGEIQSEAARRGIEREFGLVHADQRKQKQQFQLTPINAQKVSYGRSETKRAISNVLDAVLPAYRYTSLAELNAVLRQYNVLADRGNDNSRVFKNNGLVYRVLDANGNKVGVPIKASDIYSNPGLRYLQPQFEKNVALRQPHKLRVKNAIDLALMGGRPRSIDELQKALQKEKIQLVVRENKEGVVYGLTYVDHWKKCVFNGSDLGKPYSANAIQQRFQEPTLLADSQVQRERIKQTIIPKSTPQISPQQQFAYIENADVQQHQKGIVEELLTPTTAGEYVPHQLKKQQKQKRKRKRLHL